MQRDIITAMTRRILLAALFFAACRESAQAPAAVATPNDPVLRHYDIRFEQLPAPFATQSAGNPPIVGAQPANAQLHLPPGFRIAVYAAGLDDPRTMLLTPNGDVLVAEPGAGRITLLRDENHDGVAEKKFNFATGLHEPFGLAINGPWLTIGDVDAVVRIPYAAGQTTSSATPQKLASLPDGGHSTRGILFNRTATKMYVSVGSHSNVSSGEDPRRAAILEMNPDGSGERLFASGLRNPIGMAWEPSTGALWTDINERDGLGDDLVPDYVTDVHAGAFYGWPYAYLGPHEEPRRKGERPDLVKKTIAPAVLIQAHSAPIGMAFYTGTTFPAQYRGAAFVALHGSWNRTLRTGYKIISIPFRNGRPAGGYDDFVVGWSPDERSRRVWGRPACLLVLADGSLLISDDGAGKIWRVTFGR
jgi:glucose/arabinose dehydrogenase